MWIFDFFEQNCWWQAEIPAILTHRLQVYNLVKNGDFNYQPPSTGELIPDFWTINSIDLGGGF